MNSCILERYTRACVFFSNVPSASIALFGIDFTIRGFILMVCGLVASIGG